MKQHSLPNHIMLIILRAFILIIAVDGQTVRRKLPQGDSTDVTTASPAENARNISIIILIGIAATLCMALVAYITVRIRNICYRYRHGAGSEDHGPVCRKANLWGLTQAERARILPRLFQVTTFQWQGDEQQDSTNDLEGQQEKKVQNEQQLQSVATSEESSESTLENGEDGAAQLQASIQAEDAVACCSICLTAFTHNTPVMTGTRCPHVFHTQCSMEWLRLHDHCPYCREEMMTPEEFRQAAVDVLGLRRVQALELPALQGTLKNVRIPLPPLPQPGPQQRPVPATAITPVIAVEQEAPSPTASDNV